MIYFANCFIAVIVLAKVLEPTAFAGIGILVLNLSYIFLVILFVFFILRYWRRLEKL